MEAATVLLLLLNQRWGSTHAPFPNIQFNKTHTIFYIVSLSGKIKKKFQKRYSRRRLMQTFLPSTKLTKKWPAACQKVEPTITKNPQTQN